MYKVYYELSLAPEKANGLTIRKSILDPFDRRKDAMEYINLLSSFDKRTRNFYVREVLDENNYSRVTRD